VEIAVSSLMLPNLETFTAFTKYVGIPSYVIKLRFDSLTNFYTLYLPTYTEALLKISKFSGSKAHTPNNRTPKKVLWTFLKFKKQF